MPPQTRRAAYPVVEQSFGMYNIRIHCIVSSYTLTRKKEEGSRLTKLKFSHLLFSTLTMVNGTYKVGLAIESKFYGFLKLRIVHVDYNEM